MKKITLQTPNLTAQNIDKIAELFPNCITETKDENGTLKKAINFDVLKQMLSEDVIDGSEAYEFTWVGKNDATVEAFKSINKTLRPCPEESVDWDNTQNLYIEGDNLEVLKLLQESYLKKVKMIYIDPPYNTGNDFIYKDDFRMSKEEWDEESDSLDEEGNRLYRNTESNGRFHSDWCSMIYSRLLLARGLLTDDGVIFISIDDNEIDNLKKICDEIFGCSNFVAIINWKGRGGRQDSRYYAAVHEYILCYAKQKDMFVAGEEVKSGDVYPKYDEKRKRFYKTQLLRKWGSNSRREDRPNLYYPITAPDGSQVYPVVSVRDNQRPSNLVKFEGCWRHGASTMQKNIEEGRVEFIKQEDGSWIPYEKIFAPLEGEEKTKKYTTWIDDTNAGATEIKSLFGNSVFDYPKTVLLLVHFLKMANVEPGDLVLDFFSGSATTAHAVMQLNAEDGGNRRFIMVQIPEECDEKSEAYKAGYKNICEIGKERIRRAGAKIKESMAQDDSLFSSDAPKLDTGFRVFKVADSNMKDVEIQLNLYTQNKLGKMVENIKPDRTALDLLFGSALEWGYELTLPYASQQVDGCTIHTYSIGDNVLMACFDKNIPESVFRYIAKQTPKSVVFRDCGFKDCPSKINAEEIIKTLSPDTDVRVI